MSAELFRRILVPLDGSSLAEGAIDAAQELASLCHGEIILATITDETVIHGFEPFAEAERVSPTEAIRQYIEATAAGLRERGATVSTELRDNDSAAVGIVDLAAAKDVTSIILTTHGRSGIGRWFLGSVAEKVVRGAPCNVLVIRSEAR